MYILGISAYYHDSAACLLHDGEIIAAAQEERFTRIKHDPSFPARAAGYCLSHAGITSSALDCVCFYDKPFLKFERLIFTYLSHAPAGFRSFLMAMPQWLSHKLKLREKISRELGYGGKIIFPEHHESHAASAFFPSPFEEAAILTLDGVGEWATSSFGAGAGNRVQLLGEMKFPHSIGLLYSAFTHYCGFRVNSGEYKLMGLAPYGEPRYAALIKRNLLDMKDDGSFRLDMKYFNYPAGLTMINRRFEKLFGLPARAPESPLDQQHMDIAASIQTVTEEIVLKMAAHVQKVTGMKNLCLAGGVALNCVANGQLARSGIFDDIWVQPASGDAGGALGAAYIGWHHYRGNPRIRDARPDRMKGALLGPSFSDDEIAAYLSSNGIPHEKVTPADLPRRIASLIASENVVGWFQGRMEYGPRALGARSIIGDARSRTMQSTMNLKIKFRESFRPFAPAILEERAQEYFTLDRPSPYMLIVADVRHEHRHALDEDQKSKKGLSKLHIARSTIPAVTHVDNSARVQTVSRGDNPAFYDLIAEFDRLTGCPVVINTSFNVRGEPIVCTPQDAYRCFMRTNMDYLALGACIVDKRQQPPVENTIAWADEYPPD